MEVDPETMQPIGSPLPLFANREDVLGYERRGEDHVPQRTEAQKEAMKKQLENTPGMTGQRLAMALDYISDRGYIEGAWMNRIGDRCYLQYRTPGAQFNIYADGVYVGETPLGPFVPARNNPFSYKPGGFMPGAGHGSTMEDETGFFWHTSTMRISMNHVFERRIGLWPAACDKSGSLFCNQRYGDWPCRADQFREDIWSEPDWMLLSLGRQTSASSCAEGHGPEKAVDENIRTWWKASSNTPGEWICIDLGRECSVHAVQVNFTDDVINEETCPGVRDAIERAMQNMTGDDSVRRYIDTIHQSTRWILETSLDGVSFRVLEDKSRADTDLPHDLVVREEGLTARYVRLRVLSLPYGQTPCVSGLRVFGLAEGTKPAPVEDFSCREEGPLDLYLDWEGEADGYVVSWGFSPDKLYHSYMTFSPKVHLGGLMKGQKLWARIDSFNGTGITEGRVLPLR